MATKTLKPAYIRWDPHYHWYIYFPDAPEDEDMITDFPTKESALVTAECKGFEGIIQGEEPSAETLEIIEKHNLQLQGRK